MTRFWLNCGRKNQCADVVLLRKSKVRKGGRLTSQPERQTRKLVSATTKWTLPDGYRRCKAAGVGVHYRLCALTHLSQVFFYFFFLPLRRRPCVHPPTAGRRPLKPGRLCRNFLKQTTVCRIAPPKTLNGVHWKVLFLSTASVAKSLEGVFTINVRNLCLSLAFTFLK